MKKIVRAATVPQSLNRFCYGVLKELSLTYDVVGLSSPGPIIDTIREREGVRIIAVPMERRISLFKDIRSLFSLIRVFRTERPDMVHSMTPKAGLLCMIAAKITGVPVRVHTFTGLVFPTAVGLKKQVLMLTDRITCACATHVIPEGQGVKADLENYGITRKPMRVLGYGNVRGVDMDFYSRRQEVMEKASLIRDDKCFTFLTVGRLVRDKGINELIAAFKRLFEEYPHIRLFMVGVFEDHIDPINKETRSTIDSSPEIQVVGHLEGDAFLAYYAASDCYVSASYREGFPNTVLEAGAMGIPCIVTDINGSREIITDGYNGLIVPPRDSEALYLAMKKMLFDADLRASMALVSRNHVGERFEQGYVRKCLYDFYREVL